MYAEKTAMSVRKPHLQHLLAVLLMVACPLFAWWLTPQEKWFEYLGEPQFEKIIPPNFADWTQVSDGNNALIIDPQQQETLNDIYTQLVTRTYVHKSTGRRLMLSLAYGENQTYSKQMHFPNTCYSAQGFYVTSLYKEQILNNGKAIEMNRMTAKMRDRVEQVSYFVRIGNNVLGRRILFVRFMMGLKGYIPDGLLFRVSEISNENNSSYQLQDQFLDDLLKALGPADKAKLIGSN